MCKGTFAIVIFNLLPMDGVVITRDIASNVVRVLALGSYLDPKWTLHVVLDGASTGSRWKNGR